MYRIFRYEEVGCGVGGAGRDDPERSIEVRCWADRSGQTKLSTGCGTWANSRELEESV